VPYAGFIDAACITEFESLFGHCPTPALVRPIKKTRLQDMLMRPEFGANDIDPHKDEKISEVRARFANTLKGVTADALLYLGQPWA
jgi:hypothetical protein